MKIGIIGAGNIGSALAKHFQELHHTVTIANSLDPRRSPGLHRTRVPNLWPSTRSPAASICSSSPFR